MPKLDRVDAQMAFLVVVWGSAFLGIKVLADALDPFQITWYRYLPFPILYGAYLGLRRRDTFRSVTGPDWIRFAVLGAFGVIGYHFPLNWGLHDAADGIVVTGATASILVATNPLWTLLLAVARRKETFHAQSAVGILLAFVGVVVVVLLGKGHAEFTVARKALVILLAPMAWAVYSVYSKPLVGKYGGLFVTGMTMSLGTLMLVPLGLTYGTAPLHALDAEGWFWVLFLALVSTVAGYAIWNNALKHRSASSVAVYVYAQPVVTAILGAWYLHEGLTSFFVLGAALVLAGVVLVNRARLQAMKP